MIGFGGANPTPGQSVDFPSLCLGKDQPLTITGERHPGRLSDVHAVDAADWLYGSDQHELTAQTLHQQNGFSITLIRASISQEDEDLGIHDAYERFMR